MSARRSSLHVTRPSALALAGLAGLAVSGKGTAACEPPTSKAQVVEALDAAESALLWLEIEAFKLEMARLDELVDCLGEVLEPSLVAELHRFRGLRAFGERDPIASRAFAAARHLEPGYRFPEALIPPDGPVLEQYDAVALSDRRVVGVDPPARGTLIFDGSPGLDRPTEWPVMVQHLTPDGVAFSRWLRPEEPLPPYPIALVTGSEAARVGPPVPLLVATGCVAALSGALYGVALVQERRYHDLDDPVPDAELEALRARTNGLVVASAVGAAATVGGTVAVALAW